MKDYYEIMEYEYSTKRYTIIGYVEGVDSKDAKKRFVLDNSYEPPAGTTLFAKPPLCR